MIRHVIAGVKKKNRETSREKWLKWWNNNKKIINDCI